MEEGFGLRGLASWCREVSEAGARVSPVRPEEAAPTGERSSSWESSSSEVPLEAPNGVGTKGVALRTAPIAPLHEAAPASNQAVAACPVWEVSRQNASTWVPCGPGRGEEQTQAASTSTDCQELLRSCCRGEGPSARGSWSGPRACRAAAMAVRCRCVTKPGDRYIGIRFAVASEGGCKTRLR